MAHNNLPALLGEEWIAKPSVSHRQKVRTTLRSSECFVSKLDRVQVLGPSMLPAELRRTARPGRSIGKVHGHTGCINGMAWSPNGRFLATGSDDTK